MLLAAIIAALYTLRSTLLTNKHKLLSLSQITVGFPKPLPYDSLIT